MRKRDVNCRYKGLKKYAENGLIIFINKFKNVDEMGDFSRKTYERREG